MDEFKPCKRCMVEKLLKEFGKDISTNDGLNTRCLECKRAQSRLYRETNPEKCRDRTKSYDERHREDRAKKARQRRKDSPEKTYEAVRRYRSKNIERAREWYRIWAKQNPEIVSSIRNRRRARKMGAESDGWMESEILSLYGTDCHICSAPINMSASRVVGSSGWENSLQFDHVVPLARGGTDLTSNIRPSHGICNNRKKDSTKYKNK